MAVDCKEKEQSKDSTGRQFCREKLEVSASWLAVGWHCFRYVGKECSYSDAIDQSSWPSSYCATIRCTCAPSTRASKQLAVHSFVCAAGPSIRTDYIGSKSQQLADGSKLLDMAFSFELAWPNALYQAWIYDYNTALQTTNRVIHRLEVKDCRSEAISSKTRPVTDRNLHQRDKIATETQKASKNIQMAW